MDGNTRNPLVADYSEWRARDYFQTYYSEVVLPDEQAVLAYQIDVLRAARARFGRGLEYGCGPTMHRAIAASKYAFRIDMADWLADNLTEARIWLCADDSAPEWKRFTSYVLACEGNPKANHQKLIQREGMIKRNPGATMILITKSYRIFHDAKGNPLCEMGDPVEVLWFFEGREATRAEVEKSIEDGMPNLVAASKYNIGGPKALAGEFARFLQYLPS